MIVTLCTIVCVNNSVVLYQLVLLLHRELNMCLYPAESPPQAHSAGRLQSSIMVNILSGAGPRVLIT
jgi:hypothetical protein